MVIPPLHYSRVSTNRSIETPDNLTYFTPVQLEEEDEDASEVRTRNLDPPPQPEHQELQQHITPLRPARLDVPEAIPIQKHNSGHALLLYWNYDSDNPSIMHPVRQLALVIQDDVGLMTTLYEIPMENSLMGIHRKILEIAGLLRRSELFVVYYIGYGKMAEVNQFELARYDEMSPKQYLMTTVVTDEF